VTPVKDAPVIFPLPADGFAYPAPPTHQVQIDAEYGPFKSLTVLRYVARAQGRWFLVYPCPNARGLEAFAHMSAERERRLAEGRRLAAEMAPGLRSELEGLIGKGRLIEAIDRYRAATGADVDTARRAVQALAPAG
jgi:hypothetical protein